SLSGSCMQLAVALDIGLELRLERGFFLALGCHDVVLRAQLVERVNQILCQVIRHTSGPSAGIVRLEYLRASLQATESRTETLDILLRNSLLASHLVQTDVA